MAAKRTATDQLTSDNWEQEDNDEEEPVSKGFTKASKEELQKRQLKTAKRTLTNGSPGTGGIKLFPSIDLTRGFMSYKGGPVSLGGVSGGGVSLGGGMSLGGNMSASQSFPPPIISPHQNNTNSKYLKKLCSLNESVSKWISDHVKKNPCVDLTPVFEDYTKYLKDLDVEREKESVAMETNDKTENKEKEENENEKESDDESEKAEESESQEETEKKSLQLSSAPLPPGCLMAVRAKLFYKKDTQFVELGLGNLQVEESDSSEKSVRLLMRNDTTIGQILLNIRVSANIPMTLQKNNILIVCSPNPPLEMKSPDKNEDMPTTTPPTPVSYLLRVKTALMAQELYDTIKNKL